MYLYVFIIIKFYSQQQVPATSPDTPLPRALKQIISQHFTDTTLENPVKIKEFCDKYKILPNNSVFVELGTFDKSNLTLIDVILQDKVRQVLCHDVSPVKSFFIYYSRVLACYTLVLVLARWWGRITKDLI